MRIMIIQGVFSPLEFPKKEVKNPFLANKRVVDEILGRSTNLYS